MTRDVSHDRRTCHHLPEHANWTSKSTFRERNHQSIKRYIFTIGKKSQAHIVSLSRSLSIVAMITHDTLYSLANTLGALAMCTVVLYHFIAVNAKYVTRGSVAAS